jgi:V/A-type H+-transporting ATPase subunit I
VRIDVEKCLILGPSRVKEVFFSEMQTLGCAEFISSKKTLTDLPADIQNLMDALHILRRMNPVKQAAPTDYKSARFLAAAALECNERFERLKERKRILSKEISRVEPFGDFSVQQLKNIEQKTGLHFQFFFHKSQPGQPRLSDLIFISSHLGLDYYLSISKQKQHPAKVTEIIIHRSMGELKDELAEVNKELDVAEMELSSLAYQKHLLKNSLIDALNSYHLKTANSQPDSLLEDKVFAIEAWIPSNKLSELNRLADQLNLAVESLPIVDGDKIPTYLENKGFSRLGEDLVEIYDTPSFQDKDPSLWIFFSFAIFFSMIVADAGYGLIVLALSLWMKFKFGKKKGTTGRIINLALSLSIGCIFWGVMMTSFFGISVSPNSPLRKISVINWAVHQKADYLIKNKTAAYKDIINKHPELAQATTSSAFLTTVKKQTDMGEKYAIYDQFTDSLLIELSLFVGVIHLIFSLMRYGLRNLAAFGWILALIGGYLYFPSMLKATSLIYYILGVPEGQSSQIGLWMLYGGITLATVLAIIQNKLKGIAELMNVIQIFADVMSYLRIYALSLAGIVMGMTFNHISMSVPLILGIFILIAGHTINFTLALMGGLIHGLRLNFIEWYHYSFEGGGRRFNPLALLKLD